VDYGGVKTLWLSSPPGNTPVAYTRGGFDKRKFFEGSVAFSPDGSKLGAWITEVPADHGAAGISRARPAFWVVPLAGGGDPRVAPSPTPSLPNYAAVFNWLPDSRHIVSALPYPRPGVHLWMMDTESGDARLVTASGSNENDPAVSRDGARLATTFQQAN